jgi:hypothetical protein
VPTKCDAKCAIVFNDFFGRCEGLLGIQMSAQMRDFANLHSTCTELPVEPLLRAVISCDEQNAVQCMYDDDWDFAGHDITDARGHACPPVSTLQSCCDLCDDTPGCQAFTWVYDDLDRFSSYGWTSPSCCLKGAAPSSLEPGSSNHGMTTGWMRRGR